MILIMKLHPRGSGLAAFFDASSLFCHDKELNTLTDPHKILRKLGVSSGVDRNYMLSLGLQYIRGPTSIDKGHIFPFSYIS